MTVAPSPYVRSLLLRRGIAAVALAWLAGISPLSGGGKPASTPSPSTGQAAESAPFNIVGIGRSSVRSFTSKDGLPQNAITTIVTDRNGLLWIGTKDGAASYNGRIWRVLNMPAEFGKNMIADIVHSASGDMWFTLHGGGVACRHPDGSWSYYREPHEQPNELPVLLAEIDEGGPELTLVLLAQHSFLRFRDGVWESDPEFPVVKGPGVAGGASVVVGEDGVDEIWTGLPGGRTARLRLGEWKVMSVPVAPPHDNHFCFLRTTALGGGSKLLAGCPSGINMLEGDRWVPVPLAAEEDRFDNIFRMCESRSPDGSLALWCGSIDGRNYRFANGEWKSFGSETVLKDGGVWSMLATGDTRSTHAIWFGTAGLGLVRAQFGAWTSIDQTVGLVNESVYSILVTKDRAGGDVVWIGTIGGGLLRFENGVPRQVTREGGNWLMWVMCMLDVSDETTERILAGNPGQLSVIENGRVVKRFRPEEGLPGLDVTTLLPSVDASGQPFVWVGTSGGVCRFVNSAIEPRPAGLENPGGRVTCMAETRGAAGERILWVGGEKGLVRYDGALSTMYTMDRGLPTDSIMSLREVRLGDGASELWIGTRAGIARLSLDDAAAPIRTLSTTSRPALPNNTVYRIEQDAAGRLYVSTNRGVARLTSREATRSDPADFEMTVFTIEDGLPNDECNTGASTIDPRGRIWVGTLNGAAVYDPSAEIKVAPSKLVVEKQEVVEDNGRPIIANEELAHDRNHLVFEYALLSYNRESATRYRSQLVGYEPEPSDWTTEYRREFNSLPAGSYTFSIWGRDAFGNVTGPVKIPFEVSSPPWASWWAIAIYAVALVGVGYAGFQWRLRTLAQRNIQLEAAIAERTTELAHTVDELRVSQQSAQEANLAKSVFLANMSHELRTPLNAVLGFAQLLDRTGSLGAQERQKIGIIRRSGEHLLGLINDVLSLAKIEAGKLELHEQPFAPAELLAAVEAMTRVRADAKDLQFDVRIGPDFPAVVRGDDGKLRQVLLNLLGNAVKFTDSGSVRLVAEWSDGRGRFEIHDEGRGISEGEIVELFQAFSQTESGKSMPEGTGLGLTISRQIVRLMGGDITVESVPGKGSTFRFDVSLPASSASATARPVRRVRRVVPTERRRRVLVVDDSAENRLLLVSILTSVGFEVREASDGREGVAAVVDWKPRVVFMDRRMPVMDGVEATREIRRLEREDPDAAWRVVIIATTASVFEQDRDEILANGCNDLVIKPFQESEIFEMLERHANVQFEFEVAPSDDGASVQASTDGLARIADLEPVLAQKLYRALDAGDAQAAAEIAEQIAKTDSELGAEIGRRIREFRMETLIVALEESGR